jgi:hypothetical protein
MSERSQGPAAILARIPQAQAAAEMAAQFEQATAFEHLSEHSRAEVLSGLQRTLRRWSLFVSSGVMPPDGDFDPLREWTRARAAEGARLEDLLRSFGLAHQLGWELLRRHARADESDVLLELAAPLAQYVDRVSAVVTETYLAERELLVSEDERRTRSLLERLCVPSPLDAPDSELADRQHHPWTVAEIAPPACRGACPTAMRRSPRACVAPVSGSRSPTATSSSDSPGSRWS